MIRRAFTKWYADRGYTFRYEIPPLGNPAATGKFSIDTCAVWDCPWWVRPLLIFFSPSVYVAYKIANEAVGAFEQGLREGMSRETLDELINKEKEK